MRTVRRDSSQLIQNGNGTNFGKRVRGIGKRPRTGDMSILTVVTANPLSPPEKYLIELRLSLHLISHHKIQNTLAYADLYAPFARRITSTFTSHFTP